jgi:transcription elongation factor Elf1
MTPLLSTGVGSIMLTKIKSPMIDADTQKEAIYSEDSGSNQQTFQDELGNLQNEENEPDITSVEETKYEISGSDAVINDGTQIEEQNINKIGRDQNIYHISQFKRPEDRNFSCPYCDEELEVKQYGKHTCKNCKRTFIIRNRKRENDIILYKTLQPDEAKKYDKILAHINNKIQDKNYAEAYQFCKKAEELAPGEVATWENFALAEFLLEITKDVKVRKPTDVIIRTITTHIEKCKDHGMTEVEYEPLVVDIANRLYNIEKSRLNSVQAQYREKSNNPKWSRGNFTYLLSFLRSFEICYALYPDTLFLEGYVNELKKEYKWILKTANGELINNPVCSPFNAVKKLELLVEKIKAKKPDYCFPVIAEERFSIRNVFFFKINAITTKTNV